MQRYIGSGQYKMFSLWRYAICFSLMAANVAALDPIALGSQSSHQPVREQLPWCKQMLGALDHEQISALQNAIQSLQAVRRPEIFWGLMRERNGQLPEHKGKEDGWEAAYSSPLSAEQLAAMHENASRVVQSKAQHVAAMLKHLQSVKALDDSYKLVDVSSCVMGRLNTHLYEHHPTVSFLLQYFKRPWVIQKYVARLQACQAVVPSELVVNVDHPADHATWAELVTNTSGFVVPVFSNNVHEIRAYNRIAELARGKYLVLLQDDELPLPADCSWLPNVVSIFDNHPEVGIIGLKGFNYGFRPNYDNQTGMHFKDPKTQVPMQFVMLTDFAPMATRKAAWRYVGGLDESLSEAGECGIWSDWEIVTRMWVAGWGVAFHKVDREPDGHSGGTHLPTTTERCWGRQQYVSSSLYRERWGDRLSDELTGHVRALNLNKLALIDPSICPFGGGCDSKTYDGFRK